MRKLQLIAAAAVSAALLGCSAPAEQNETAASFKQQPHLEKRGDVTQLIVKDKPFLALAGELAGSSATSGIYMDNYWKDIKAAGLNTLLATVYWEQLEPVKGEYDFTRVDDLIKNARENDLHLVFLWFASWKNGVTSHIPIWMKEDCETYKLARTKEGKAISILSTLCQANWEADAKAFGALMEHIREIDADQQTVLMIQLENEMGLHGHTRDYSPEAVAAFEGQVPEALISYLKAHKDTIIPETRDAWAKSGFKESGTWEEVFGKGDLTDEMFMAWNYASYMEHVAQAGKDAYPIPFFVNTWLVQPEDSHPGNYPSGGPQPQNHEMWRAAAPHVDILAPDIYLSDFPGILRRFMRGGNPGFIPESSAGVRGAANAAFAFGEMSAVGYSPMGVERMVTGADFVPFTAFYNTVESMMDEITAAQAEGRIRGIWLKKENEPAKAGDYNPVITHQEITMGKWTLLFDLMTTSRRGAAPSDWGYAMVIQDSPNEYTIIGCNLSVTFKPADGNGFAGLGRTVEGRYENGTWVPLRWLNGDDVQLRYDILNAIDEGFSSQGIRYNGDSPSVYKVTLYGYR